MHINRIPSDIICLIIQQVCGEYIDKYTDLDDWKHSLKLIAVCQNWRRLGVPYVYSYVTVVSSDSDTANGGYDSNLHLTIDAQASRHTKKFKIWTKKRHNPFQIIEQVLKNMATAGCGWNHVTNLQLSFSMSYFANEKDSDNLVKQFADIFPNINNLAVDGNLSEFCHFFNSLANFYMPKLTALEAPGPLQLTTPKFPQNLTRLVLQFPNEGFVIPAMCAELLCFLELTEVPCNINWGALFDQDKSNEILFLNLEYLRIDYIKNSQPTHLNNSKMINRNCKFHFPKLQALRMDDPTEDCHILKNGVFPSTMKNVHVSGFTGAFAHLANQRITHVNRLDITCNRIAEDSIEATHVVPFINTIMVNIKAKNMCYLTMFSCFDQVNTANINWPYLTHLHLFEEINASTVLQVLPKLPCLEMLDMFKLVIDVNSNDISVPLPDNTQLVDPVNSKISDLSFHIIIDEQRIITIAWAKYLILHLSSLTKLKVGNIPENDLQRIVNDYKNLYPHLANISFSNINNDIRSYLLS